MWGIGVELTLWLLPSPSRFFEGVLHYLPGGGVCASFGHPLPLPSCGLAAARKPSHAMGSIGVRTRRRLRVRILRVTSHPVLSCARARRPRPSTWRIHWRTRQSTGSCRSLVSLMMLHMDNRVQICSQHSECLSRIQDSWWTLRRLF